MRSIAHLVCWLCFIAGLSGCSFSKIFPDKRQEYKYSREIPALEVPPDLLAAGDFEGQPFASSGTLPQAGQPQASAPAPEPPARPSRPVHESAEWVKEKGVPAYIRIQSTGDEVWPALASAIERAGLKILDRDRARGAYDIAFQKKDEQGDTEEEGLFGQLAGIFGLNTSTYAEYQIVMEEERGLTQVRILDRKGRLTTDGRAFLVLKLIHGKLINPGESVQDQPAKPSRDPTARP